MAYGLTRSKIDEAWRSREGGRSILRDGAGLSLVIGADSASWVLEYRLGGLHPGTGKRWPNQKLTLGRLAPEFHLREARLAANEARLKVARGIDPNLERRTELALAQAETAAASLTIAGLIDQYRVGRQAAWSPATRTSVECQFRAIVADEIGALPVTKVTRKHLAQFLVRFHKRQMAAGTKGTLGRLIEKQLSALFRYAENEEIIDVSPAVRLPKLAKLGSRDRVLSAGEIIALWTVLDAALLPPALVLQLSLATGQRIGAVAAAAAAELDLEGSLLPDSDGKPCWRMPPEPGRKTDLARVLPLSALAVDLWRQALAFPGRNGPQVFPSRGPRGHLLQASVSNFWAKLHADGKTPPGATAHDLRRTARTWWSGLPHGQGSEAMERLLGHVVGNQVSRIYDHALHLPAQRAVADAWGTKLALMLAGGGEVLPMHRFARPVSKTAAQRSLKRETVASV